MNNTEQHTQAMLPELHIGRRYRLTGLLFKQDEWLNPFEFTGLEAAENVGYLLVFRSTRNGTVHYEPAYGVGIDIQEVSD